MRLWLLLSYAFSLCTNASMAGTYQTLPLAPLAPPAALLASQVLPAKTGMQDQNILIETRQNTDAQKSAAKKLTDPFDDVPAVVNASPALTPTTLSATQRMADAYKRIAERGGWPKVSAVAPRAHGDKVRQLRLRLAAEGDMTPNEARAADVYNDAVTAAIKRFQERMGLAANGNLTPATLRAMNIPASERARALAASVQRLSQMRLLFAERYVVVNLPSATVEAIDHGQVVRRYDAIMGDVEHQSPDVVATIQAVNLNPTWTVPASIIKNEIIPKMREDKDYLAKLRIRIFDNRNVEIKPETLDWNSDKPANYVLRQDSGEGNSLGQIRINMPNKYAVYMHDTPAKHLFSRADHYLSHGCVRVKGVYDLAQWVLEKTPAINSLVSTADPSAPLGTTVWTKQALHDKVATHEMIEVRVAKEIPVMWVYMTGWVGGDGRTYFRPDVYHRDDTPQPAPAPLKVKTEPARVRTSASAPASAPTSVRLQPQRKKWFQWH